MLERHPFNDLPAASVEEFDSLVESLSSGFMPDQPIVIYQGKILDRWNRYWACELAGVEPEYEEFPGTDEEARQLVHERNIPRRPLSDDQRAVRALKYIPALTEIAKQRQGTRTDLDQTLLQSRSKVGRNDSRRQTREGHQGCVDQQQLQGSHRVD